jgi:hypothetical protein
MVDEQIMSEGCASRGDVQGRYLIAPEHGIALLALGFVPYLEQLLQQID